ncbi:MAG TPA: EtfB protein [Myxococcales bacterium]|nr:EtfB protein [Deltaproteobacteria bacterium]MBU51833.1 EtfB protein [Deltaproteobacteria bacterium]HAA54619.1 EtfB protein [Myxococcales bacterium]|tara:strand:- start:1013 stop:1807 length:795 start_codon:yes stop_codon:yes gene_type:complete
MKILVSLKRVEHWESKIKLNGDASGIVTDGLTYVINPFDEIALEESVRLKSEHDDVEVVVVSIGSEDATQQLRTGLAFGTDRAILVKTEGPLDPDGAARILQAIAEREEPQMILMGKQAIDDDANQTGQLLAEYLSWPQATFVSKMESLESDEEKAKQPAIEIEDEVAVVVREVDGGLQTAEIDLPAVITVQDRLNVPRYPALPNILKAKKKPFETLTVDDLGLTLEPKVTVLGYESLPERQAGVTVETVDELLEKLRNEAKVL